MRLLETENLQNGACLFAHWTRTDLVPTVAATHLMPTGRENTIHLLFATNDALPRRMKETRNEIRDDDSRVRTDYGYPKKECQVPAKNTYGIVQRGGGHLVATFHELKRFDIAITLFKAKSSPKEGL